MRIFILLLNYITNQLVSVFAKRTTSYSVRLDHAIKIDNLLNLLMFHALITQSNQRQVLHSHAENTS